MTARKAHIVVVDDQPDVLAWLVEVLSRHYTVEGSTDPSIALDKVLSRDIDLLLTDIQMPQLSGLDLLAQIHKKKPRQLVFMMTAFGSIELAIETVRAGACDFIAKPFQEKALLAAIARALGDRPAQSPELVAVTDTTRKALDFARRAARVDSPVLITGEHGVGKGTLARYIHELGRADKPYLELRGSTLTNEELARAVREATHGTLFIDEVSELSPEVQRTLLGLLDGAKGPLATRVIAATHRALPTDTFRRDLFYCLNIIPIELPPLRERREDIPALVQLFLKRSGRKVTVAEEAMHWLLAQAWPGNVRQLSTVIARAIALSDDDTLSLEDIELPQAPVDDAFEHGLIVAAERHLSLDALERAYIKHVIGSVSGNMSEAARILQIDRRTLYRKLAT